MVYAVVARPPVLGGKVKSFDDAEALKVPGVLKIVAIDRTPAPAVFQPLGGVAVIADQHLGRDQGPRGAEDRVGRRPARAPTPPRPTRRRWRQRCASPAARWCATTATPTTALAGAAKTHRGGILHAASRACDDGAAGGGRADRRRQVRGLGAACSRRRRRATTWRSASASPAENVTVNVTLLGGGFGRKSKPDFVVEAALAVQGDGRQAGQADLDPRGRHHQRLLPRRLGGADRGRARRMRASRSPGCIAAPRRPSSRSSRPTRSSEAAFELGMGLVDMPFDIPNVRIENPRGRRRTRASAGSARSTTSRTPSRCSPSPPSWRRRPAATRRTICWS